jgi:serine protease Do
MKRSKIITSLLVVPLLALAACSGSPSAFVQSAQNQVSAQTSGTVSQTSAQSAAPAASSPAVSGSVANLQGAFESIYQQVSPSVVTIEVVQSATTTSSSGNGNSPLGRNPFSGNSGTSTALGSGFIWDKQGDIVTNNHVVSGATQITVTFLDGTTVTAQVVGTDPNSDLAVIKVSVPASELVPVTLADSTQVKVGDMAIAIGNPFGEGWTMTQGIISGLARSLPTNLDSQTTTTGPTYSIPDIIQTDAPINPGNSGGVLLNLEGQVIGVTSAIESNSGSSAGIGFVIPSEIVNKVIPSLISTGAYNHPYLGITGTDMTSDLATAMNLPAATKGALVVSVTSGGPAATAGVLGSTQNATIGGQTVQVGGDVITAVNGQPIQNMDDLSSYLFLHTTAGQSVTLTILRNGKSMTLKLTTGILPVQ